VTIDTLEDNRVNKAVFFLRKLKIRQCREAINECRLSSSISKVEALLRKHFYQDLAGFTIKKLGTQLESAEIGYRLGIYR
jgi:hypothetical protein